MSLRHNDSKHGTPRTRGRTWQRIRLQARVGSAVADGALMVRVRPA